MKNSFVLVLLLSLFLSACRETNEMSEMAAAKKEKFLQLVEKYDIEGYEVPESEEIWINLDLEKLEATYKRMREQKTAFEEREKRMAEIHQTIEEEMKNAENPKEKMKEMAKRYPEYFVTGKQE